MEEFTILEHTLTPNAMYILPNNKFELIFNPFFKPMEEFIILEHTLTPHSMVPLPNHKM